MAEAKLTKDPPPPVTAPAIPPANATPAASSTPADAPAATDPPEASPAVQVTGKSLSQLQADYDASLLAVQRAVKDGTLLRDKLMKDVNAKVKAQGGDVEKLQEKKRAAYAALVAAGGPAKKK